MSGTTKNAKKDHTISLRISDELHAELNAEKEASGKSVSQIVIDRISGCKPVTVVEGKAIAACLFNLRNMLDAMDTMNTDNKEHIRETLEKLVDVLLSIEEKYLEEG